ncbi:MAG: glycosyltransferase [Nitrospirae bacterium]|nr:glycosyltransferase [Nitrospirota bacterium]
MGDAAKNNLAGKRIVILLWTLELGGAERQAIALARYFKNNKGADVKVLAFNTPGLASVLCDDYGIPWGMIDDKKQIVSHSFLSIIRSTFAIIKILKRNRTEILFGYTTPPNIMCSFASRFAGVRAFIWSQRRSGSEKLQPFDYIAAKYFAKWFISNSERGAHYLRNAFGVKADKIRIIHNGVELADPKEDKLRWRKNLKIGENDFIACMVANLHQGKDHVTLLNAWSIVVGQLKAAKMNAVLVLAGQFFSTYQSLMDLTRNLGIEYSVIFLGQVQDISGLLGSVDLSILTSYSEGLPNGVLESMASGLPVVGTDVSGIREALGKEGEVYLVPPGCADLLAERILFFAAHPEVRRVVGEANRKRIADIFGLQKMCTQTEEYVNEILAGKNS